MCFVVNYAVYPASGGASLLYGRFDDRAVTEFQYPHYGDQQDPLGSQYPRYTTVRYPKVKSVKQSPARARIEGGNPEPERLAVCVGRGGLGLLAGGAACRGGGLAGAHLHRGRLERERPARRHLVRTGEQQCCIAL